MNEAAARVIGHPDRIGLCTRTLFGHRQLSVEEVLRVVDATADAGFGEASIWTAHVDWARAGGVNPEQLFLRHRDRGLRIVTCEILTGWTTSDHAAITAANEAVLNLSAQSGAPYVVAITMEPELPALSETASGLAHLCDLAADQGLAVSFEFLPFSRIPTIADAARLLEAVDRDNLGLVIDTSHWFRQPGGPDFDTLRTIPAERIHVVQLADLPAARANDAMVETGTARLLPGEGDIDIVGLLDTLADMGAQPAVSAEVFSLELMERGPAEFARLQFETTRKVLEAHWAARTTQ
jgi:sugar phosphate isomerase/epimerase